MTGEVEGGVGVGSVGGQRLERIARRAATGDREALAMVYRELAPAVLGYLRARGAADAEALTSEVFVQVVRRARALPPDWQGLRTYVFRAAHSRLIDEWRRSGTRGVHVVYDPQRDDRSVGSAESEAMSGPATSNLLGLLELLPHDQRAALTLRFVADLSLQQTAEVMGCSVSWVGQLQRTALDTLRAYLSRDGCENTKENPRAGAE